MTVTIIGLGYVGFPLALQIASKGHKVLGLDKDEQLLKTIKNNESPITNNDHINKLLSKEELEVDSSISESEIYIICVPTPVYNKELPDLTYVKDASREITTVLKENDLVGHYRTHDLPGSM